MVSMFEKEIRCTAIGIAYNVANAIFAGTAPFIQSKLALSFNHMHPRIAPAIYIMAVTFISFCTLMLMVPRLQLHKVSSESMNITSDKLVADISIDEKYWADDNKAAHGISVVTYN
jgi:hypothetical protein